MRFRDPPHWEGTSSDPNDEQFGHVVNETSIEDASDFDAVLVGEPYDGAVIGRRGARDGPAAIRRELASSKSHHFDEGPVSGVGDLGDLPIDELEGGVADVQSAVADETAHVYERGALPVFLGGDNSLTVANVKPLLDRDASIGVISFDAHLDCREPQDGPSSGTPYRQLFDAGLDTLAVVGARHFETSTTYADFLRDSGGTILTADEVGRGATETADFALDALSSCDHVFVSLDVDVLDETAAPGVSAPTPGGITTRELFSMLRRVASDSRVVGFEVVECAPPLDDDDQTARAAARAVAHFLSGVMSHV
ncbi:formimidoylglutamase (plasmid) [Haloferax mediterranei ATCC 33500]|uniref:Formimidoylglutamase n=1 Tax=Haloferax mediterranei (strain ATCC 33500 / DSM 1411 / JCM 8866 / NBRC 14739 / NCIMB 2177 / R-4) TaxID=523841 RepID=I3RB41_HALMT|nr:formimidoylglutamase [Haloferax mediterranei]AFK21451.1 formimidoylglutamase [Haloferax mediterranei ATCC 33500]AHZ24481.1 formimidoylglutamase [Haloferax mediterranei ATCC 33500]ELZ97231.1 formimidoylglutamase [Haloferax mediterranei ATCC 33500]MDX5990032.1 formimidoylglutamase [Haloferax mediterranei ATCC 33500]QCQ76880.1 formimidoylglutamase [Haloferax mediterranei ATCC 33500]